MAGGRCSRRACWRSRRVRLCGRTAVRMESAARSGCCRDPPDGLADALRRFWFDVTKADWRDTMVLKVPRAMVARPCSDVRVRPAPAVRLGGPADRARRPCPTRDDEPAARRAGAHDLRRQRGLRLQLQRRRRARLLSAVAPDGRSARRARDSSLAGNVLQSAPPRGSAPRSSPTRGRGRSATIPRSIAAATIDPTRVLAALTAGLDDRHAMLLTDLNWQVQNGLSYFGKAMRRRSRTRGCPTCSLRAGAHRRQHGHRPRCGR